MCAPLCMPPTRGWTTPPAPAEPPGGGPENLVPDYVYYALPPHIGVPQKVPKACPLEAAYTCCCVEPEPPPPPTMQQATLAAGTGGVLAILTLYPLVLSAAWLIVRPRLLHRRPR